MAKKRLPKLSILQARPLPALSPRAIESFWLRVEKTEKCWLWSSYVSHEGYGLFKLKTETTRPKTREKRWKIFPVHRIAYELLVGPIPPGYTLDHLCRVRHCVNPAHLEPVLPAENIRRGKKDPKAPRVYTPRYSLLPSQPPNPRFFRPVRPRTCHRGHRLVGDNLREYKGKLFCRRCVKLRAKSKTFLSDDQIHSALIWLTTREADILRKRFGLDGAKPMTFQEIGKDHDLTRERIRQLQKEALQKIRLSLAPKR